MNNCPHTRVQVHHWHGQSATECQDCGAIVAKSPAPALSAEEAIARLRNRENGLPPALEQFLDEQCRDDAERASCLQVLEDLLRAKARQEFAERYPDDLDDEDVSVEEMERLIAEMRQRKQQQAGN